jgi:phospho-N-acetylmuramoyl-pentapeptide-transferase
MWRARLCVAFSAPGAPSEQAEGERANVAVRAYVAVRAQLGARVTAILIAAGVGLIFSMVSTPLLIRWLRANGIGQQIREDGPQGHFTKAGTPTMGGLAIMGAALAGYLAAHVKTVFTQRGFLAMLAIGGAALVGFLDDWIKVTRHRSLGLNKRAKSAGQLLVAVGFALGCAYWLKVDTHLSFTRFNSLHVSLSQVGWVVWAVLVILAATNAVNFTDGLDGLAAGSSSFAFAAFTVIGFYQLRHFNIYRNPASLDEAVIAGALMGACAGFLWWNAAPARIFMGDTGSLGIGAALAALALLQNVDLLLPVIGGLFVVETLSVIIQIISFRLFGRRVFRMAPIHHHFELLGWPETTVIVRFWILAGLCTALSLGIFYADFLARGGAG